MDTALQSSVYVSSPEFAGWLMKRGFHWRKLWKRRWVALHGAEIVYMDKEPTLENSATMTITKAQITTATVIDRDDLDGHPHGFAVHINDGQTPTWYLRADSQREKKSWLMRLSHVHAIVKWLEDFEKVKVLGVGGTGIVYELLHKSNGQRFAMKEMEIKNKQQMQMAISEAEMLKDIMENVSHPNIMHIEKVFQVGSKFYLVFPLCTGGELYEHIIRRGHFSERDAAKIVRDLVSALHALHTREILHLDIKPENILFDSLAPDAQIKLTDFGLSKLFSDASKSSSSSRFSLSLMQERLRLFQETGELNRERLRGTIGYMSPELILTGHCCKATDVFAAGVVLFILLSGRPPFNSKSNREVLEKTCRGHYSMEGAEWDEVSEEAKDLVRRMLTVNPEERITTRDILAHSWLRILEEESDSEREGDGESDLGSVLSLSPTISIAKSTGSFNRRGSATKNLTNALRQLSGTVRQMRSEKLASNMTRLVSLLQNSSGSKSALCKLYLRSKEEEKTLDGVPLSEVSDEDLDTIMLNSDFRQGLVAAFNTAGEENNGRLSIEQLLSVIKSINSLNIPANGAALVPLIVCKFIDRDGDGFISADDIFATQAQFLQRSEAFLKLMFRIYAESIWYPGRQLNLMSLQQQQSSSKSNDSPSTPGGTKVLQSNGSIAAVVEPPKFITSRHVAAVFEKMGFDPAAAPKVFSILLQALSRFKKESCEETSAGMDCIAEEDEERDSVAPSSLAKALGDEEDEAAHSTAKASAMSSEAALKVDSVGRMDFNDFCKAAELDDVLVQAVCRRSRVGLLNVMRKVETRIRATSQEELMKDEGSSKRTFRDLKQEITASVIEEELLRSSLGQMRISEQSRAAFPIAHAVRNVALGFATKVATGAQAFMDATHEVMESEDSLHQSHLLHTSKDSDDEA